MSKDQDHLQTSEEVNAPPLLMTGYFFRQEKHDRQDKRRLRRLSPVAAEPAHFLSIMFFLSKKMLVMGNAGRMLLKFTYPHDYARKRQTYDFDLVSMNDSS